MQLPYYNLQFQHWNPGATAPLIIPIQVICNTPDERLFCNVYDNSRNGRPWLKQEPAHKGVAVICGSGPSLGDLLDEVWEERALGGTVFALNGAAAFLDDHGLMPEYQVILDARPETLQLVGPAHQHLFASQVDPSLFQAAPRAKIWQLQIQGIDFVLPDEYEDEFCLIGGAASVGNTALCVAYALGYREFRLYGYDSSHRDGRGHAFPQPLNSGDPLAHVNFNGKEYVTSLTMKLQAEKFQRTARELERLGCKIIVNGHGLLPDMWNAPREKLEEYEKYQRMWDIPAYRNYSPGEHCAQQFLKVADPPKGAVVADFGCGTGRGSLALKAAGLSPILYDFVDNCRDPAARELPFERRDLTQPFLAIPRAEYGYCTDVMEHIHPLQVEVVLANIFNNARTVFFQISTVEDAMGALINQELHLTVQPADWWAKVLGKFGTVLWEEVKTDAVCFLVEGFRYGLVSAAVPSAASRAA